MTTARDHALIQIDSRRLPGWRSDLIRRPRQRGREVAAPSDPRDRALAENITIGVIKNLLLLRHLIEHYSKRPLNRIEPLAQKILAVALYQLRFLQRIPASAAVDEAVEQTRRFGVGRADSFVNAVLRAATRDPDPALPSRAEDPREYARLVLSHPPELFDRLAALLGTEDARRVCVHDNGEPPTILRLVQGVDPARLEAAGVQVTPHGQAGLFVVEPAKQPVLAEWASEGIGQVQDPTAALVVPQCDVRTGQAVLDRCAGLGTKTMQLRESLGESGMLVAVDPNEARCEALRQLLASRGISNVQVYQASRLGPFSDALPRAFDRVLVDVPCSNSGVLARRPEARYAQDEQSLKSLAQLQTDILKDTASWVAPGGLLVYSTCSIWPEENQQRVEQFMASHQDFDKTAEQLTLPSMDEPMVPARYHDGGYYAVLRKR
jgi:16S rRNA (cytosine967-C5)-methyltransferase